MVKQAESGCGCCTEGHRSNIKSSALLLPQIQFNRPPEYRSGKSSLGPFCFEFITESVALLTSVDSKEYIQLP
jgi:hypothetical protein